MMVICLNRYATFRDNMISPMLLPDICAKYGKLYNDALIIVENNNQGTMVCRELYYELEYENMFLDQCNQGRWGRSSYDPRRSKHKDVQL